MSNFDYLDEQPEPKKKKQRSRSSANAGGNPDMLWNVLTVLILFMAFCIAGFFLSIFINPYTPFNPFPPPTLAPILTTPTPTITPRALGPTWTVTPPPVLSETPTLRPTITPLPSGTPFLVYTLTPTNTPTNTATATKTPKPVYAFTASVAAYESTITHPEAACAWMGIGGTVVDAQGNPVVGLVVAVGGSLDGKTVYIPTVSNTAPLYGQGGFEFVLGDKPIASKNTLYVQLLDQAGIPLSDRIFFTTYDDCAKNLTIVRFNQVK